MFVLSDDWILHQSCCTNLLLIAHVGSCKDNYDDFHGARGKADCDTLHRTGDINIHGLY